MSSQPARPARFWIPTGIVLLVALATFYYLRPEPTASPPVAPAAGRAASQPTSAPSTQRTDAPTDLASLRALVDKRLASHGRTAAETTAAQVRFGRALLAAGEIDEATATLRAALSGREIHAGPDSLAVAEALVALGTALRRGGEHAAAESHLLRALAIRTDRHGDDDIAVAEVWLELARVHRDRGALQDAVPASEAALEVYFTAAGPHAAETNAARRVRVELLLADGDYAAAEGLARALYEWCLETHGRNAPQTATAMSLVGAALFGLERHNAAEPMLVNAANRLDRSGQGTIEQRRVLYERVRSFYEVTSDRAQEALWRGKLAMLPEGE